MTLVRSKILQWTMAVSISLFVSGSVLAQVPQVPTAGKTSGDAHTGQAVEPA
jgi:hypothetical protein